MENKIATTIEQSKKLLELGIDQSTADMYWWHYGEKTYLSGMYDGEFNKREKDVPAWSLSALLELIPSATLVSSNDHYYRLHCIEKFSEWYDNSINAVFEMIVYLKENKLI